MVPNALGCPFPHINLESMSIAMFVELFKSLKRPVILQLSPAASSTILSLTTFSKPVFSSLFKGLDVMAGFIPYAKVFGERGGFATIDEFISYMDQVYQQQQQQSILHPDQPVPYYVFDSQVFEANFANYFKLPSFINSLFPNVSAYYQLMLGPAGSGAPFHFHCTAVNFLIFGQKRWYLSPPSSSWYSKRTTAAIIDQIATNAPDWAPDANSPIYSCEQNSLEVVYVPEHWSHATFNTAESIGFATEFDVQDC